MLDSCISENWNIGLGLKLFISIRIRHSIRIMHRHSFLFQPGHFLCLAPSVALPAIRSVFCFIFTSEFGDCFSRFSRLLRVRRSTSFDPAFSSLYLVALFRSLCTCATLDCFRCRIMLFTFSPTPASTFRFSRRFASIGYFRSRIFAISADPISRRGCWKCWSIAHAWIACSCLTFNTFTATQNSYTSFRESR